MNQKHLNPTRNRITPTDAIAWGMILLYIVTFSWLAILRHASFNSSAFDLGIYDQVVWNTLHGRLYFYTTTGQPLLHFSNHADPSLIFVAPFYLIFDSPITLLVLQATVIGLGGLPVFWLARQMLKSNFAALSLLVAYLSFPSLQIVPLWDFHPPALATGLLLYAFYFMVRRKYGWFLLFAVISMGFKEQIPLIVSFMGLYLLVIERRWRIGAVTIAIAAVYFLVIMYWVIPANSVVGKHLFLGYYADLGSTPAEIIVTAITRPDIVLKNVWQPAKLAYLRDILAPFGFLPLLGLPVLLIGLPSLAINLLSANPAMHDATQAQYISTVAPWLALGAVFGLHTLYRGGIRLFPRAERWLLPVLSIAVLLVASYFHIVRGRSPLSFARPRWEITAHDRLAERFIAQIPPDAPLSAQSKLYPHVAHRIKAYQFPDVNDAEYVFLDVTTSSWPIHPNDLQSKFEELLASGEFGILDAADGYILLKRGLPRTTLPDEFYSFARAENSAAPQYPARIRFGDNLLLTGYDVLDLVNDRGGSEVAIRWYWQALSAIKSGVRVYPFFVDDQNRILEDITRRPLVAQRWYPPQRWQPGETIVTETIPWDVGRRWSLGVGALNGGSWTDWNRRLPVFPEDVEDSVRLFDAKTWARLATFARRGRALVKLDTAPPEITPANVRQVNFDDQIELQGYTVEQTGRRLQVTLFWRAKKDISRDYSVFVHVVNTGGDIVAQHDGQPGWQVTIPTGSWLPGETVLDRHTIELPADLPPGTYTLNAGIYYWETLERLPVLENGAPVDNFVTLGSVKLK